MNNTEVSTDIKDGWFKSYWRPAMAWQYWFICMYDFFIAHILINYNYFFYNIGVYTSWDPLTLKGGAFYHVAMGAIVGVAAYSRGQEKMTIMSETSNRDGSATRSYFQSGKPDNGYNRYNYNDEYIPRGGPFK